jgi:hypothetical protein
LVAIALAVCVACGQILTIEFTDEPAVFHFEGSDVSVGVHLRPSADLGRSRFERHLEVLVGTETILSEQLAYRWARAVRMNLYLDAADPGTLIIQEREYTVSPTVFRVIAETRRFESLRNGVPEGMELRFVGAFDADSTSRWRFIPAAERGELPLPEPER